MVDKLKDIMGKHKPSYTPIKKITFQEIWDNRTTEAQCINPKTKTCDADWKNQCAIRVGYALEKAGVNFASFKGRRCPYGTKRSGLVASAEELKNWLQTQPFPGCPKALKIPQKECPNWEKII